MTHETAPKFSYHHHSLKHWLDLADTGQIALPNFQRSFLWDSKPEKAARYLKSMLLGHPTGIYLTLQVDKQVDKTLQFESRNFVGVTISNPEPVTELILDGQQRLTSLWQILRSDSPPPYFIRVNSFDMSEIAVMDVFHSRPNSAETRRLLNPVQAYEECCIPVSVLNSPITPPPDAKTSLWQWCHIATKGNAENLRILQASIENSIQLDLMERAQLWYCQLPSTMDNSDIINIFIETNRSPVIVKHFDIVTAMALGEHKEDLRSRAELFYKNNPSVSSYLPKNDQKWIPELGEWFLKIGCLKTRLPSTPRGLPPTESNYIKVLLHAFETPEVIGSHHFDELQDDLIHAIKIIENCGGFTRWTLPGLPELYVIGALRKPFEHIKKSAHQSIARELLSSYLWRAFFSDRYNAQANTKLFEDYSHLIQCLEEIAKTGRLTTKHRPLIFDDKYGPPDSDAFLETGVGRIPWIAHTNSRLSCAIVALSLRPDQGVALDWVSRMELNAENIRDLENRGEINRHHIFPRDFLKNNHVPPEEIDSPLNGVILRKRSNLDLGSKDPLEYLDQIMEEANIEEKELRDRIESHLIPYDPLRSKDSPATRYRNFREERARLLASELKKLTAFPGTRP